MVQLIGGEPTLHPDIDHLIRFALSCDLEVEVYTNLVHVSAALWDTFALPGVRLATSWYTDDPGEHEVITGRPTLARTRDGIAEALHRSIRLRAGLVGVRDGQRTAQARQVLEALGVTDIGYDDLRQVGRGVRDLEPGTDQLCGHCGDGQLAVAPDGTVWPCVFARWLPVGNLRESSLRDVLAGKDLAAVSEELTRAFTPLQVPCVPKMCDPQCGPNCSPTCNPQKCRPICRPQYG